MRQGENRTGPVPSQMLTALMTTMRTMKITTRIAIFAGVDLMDASLPPQAGSIQGRLIL